MIFFLELAKAAESMGITRIDLGRGQEKFKTSLASGGMPVAEGEVGFGVAARAARRMYLKARQWIESSRFHQPVRAAYRRARGLFATSYGDWHR